MRIRYAMLAAAATALFVLTYWVNALPSLPPDGSACLSSGQTCNYNQPMQAGSPGCNQLPNGYCGPGSNLDCTYCDDSPNSPGANICVQVYGSSTICDENDGSFQCGTTFTSHCSPTTYGVCSCDTPGAINTGDDCWFPTCD
jgi:hypothetical protein